MYNEIKHKKGVKNLITLTLKDPVESRLLIAENGKSLRGFSEKIGISHAYLSQILSGKRNPSPTIGYKISRGLDIDIKEIFLIKSSAENGHKEVTK